MPHEFAENEFELEPASSSAGSGGPPRKSASIGILDPPVPPKRPPLFLRVLGGVLLLGLTVGILYLLLARR